MKTKKTQSRGMRNNNPLNIRIGNTWLGERDSRECTDGEFEEFCELKYGLRAGFCILRRYIRHYHRDTLRKIIASWAPPVENRTETYINFVAERVGIDPGATIDYADADTMCRIVQAMCKMECGETIDYTLIRDVYNVT